MTSTTTLLIDNVAFAKKNAHMAGTLALAQCPRVAAILAASANTGGGEIQYALQGKTDAAGRHLLHLSIICQLNSQCQRCLGDMPLALDLHFNYWVTDIVNDTEGAELDNEDDLDLQQNSPNMDVLQLIEDELIMALPIAPMHENQCGALKTQSGEKPNPFAVLKGLIKPE